MWKTYWIYTRTICLQPQHKPPCTGLSKVLHGQASHDRFTRLLAGGTIDSKRLWRYAKPLVEEMVDLSDCVVVGIDDTIQEKPHSRQNELICWHYDHTKGQTVKGINVLSAVLTTGELATPIGVAFVRKSECVVDAHGELRRRSAVTKNELFRRMLRVCWENCWFDYVATDSWYASKQNMEFISDILHRDFFMAVKSNRLVAVGEADKQAGCWTSIKTLAGQDQPLKVWLRGMDDPVLLIKQVFKTMENRSLPQIDQTMQQSGRFSSTYPGNPTSTLCCGYY